MTKTFTLTLSLAVAVLGFAAAASPAQAATRLMSSTPEGFEYRCERHGGIFEQAGAQVNCQTPTVPVACEYFATRQAVCEWPGIQNQLAVIRVIGTLPANYSPTSSGDNSSAGGKGGGNGGGFDGPKDIQDAPQNDPEPNFDGPSDIKDAP